MTTQPLTAPYAEHPCVVHKSHYPRPLRSVKHHIWPQEFGGPTVEVNLVWVCDTGHYNIHHYLDKLRRGEPIPHTIHGRELELARIGWDRIQRNAL